MPGRDSVFAWMAAPLVYLAKAVGERYVGMQVLGLVELESLAGAVVGRPGQTGLSVEQRKRLTIAVELVANPSIVFMDEPTSGTVDKPKWTNRRHCCATSPACVHAIVSLSQQYAHPACFITSVF